MEIRKESILNGKRNKLILVVAVWLFVLALFVGKTCYAQTYTVKVSSGYLALRTAQAYDSGNEIGQLYTGDTVDVITAGSGTYWYVYSSKYNKEGYVNKSYLVDSGNSGGASYTVSVSSGYLALRNAKAYDSKNEIGQLYSGDVVQVQQSGNGTYWYVYSPKLGKSGYVNKNYLVGSGSTSGANYVVSVSSGYLALRNAKAYDSKNEIGQLYSGDLVKVQQTGNGTYWYVYSPKLGKSGYVNKDYIYPENGGSGGQTTGPSYTVKVSSGYLALRNAQAYDSSNEIGQLYTGDVVQVQQGGSGTYWYVYSSKLGKSGYVNKNYLY